MHSFTWSPFLTDCKTLMGCQMHTIDLVIGLLEIALFAPAQHVHEVLVKELHLAEQALAAQELSSP